MRRANSITSRRRGHCPYPMASTAALVTKKSWFSGLKYSSRTCSKKAGSCMGQFLGIWSSFPDRQASMAHWAQVNMEIPPHQN